MTFKLIGLFSDKKGKYRVAPAPAEALPAPKVGNFMQDAEDVYYVAVPGNAQLYATQKTPPPYAELNHFQKSQVAAFNHARNAFAGRAFAIFKVNISTDQLATNVATVDKKKIVKLNLVDIASSVEGFSYQEKDANKGQRFALHEKPSPEDVFEPRTPSGR